MPLALMDCCSPAVPWHTQEFRDSCAGKVWWTMDPLSAPHVHRPAPWWLSPSIQCRLKLGFELWRYYLLLLGNNNRPFKANKEWFRAFKIMQLKFDRNNASGVRYFMTITPPEKYMFTEIMHFSRLLLHSKILISFFFNKSLKNFPHRLKRLTWPGSHKRQSMFLTQNSLV